jgi:Ca2+-binding EF-hand superfamily protein
MTKETIGLGLIAALAVACSSEPTPPPQTAQDWQQPSMGTMPEATPEEPEFMAGTEPPMTETAPVQQSAFERYDADGDKRITRTEIGQGTGAEMVMPSWDTNGDGSISPDELATVFFASIDQNGDGMIDKQEYDQGAAAWMGAKSRAAAPTGTTGQTSQVPGQTGQVPGQTAGQTQVQPPGQAQKLAAAFQGADKNRDQKLDQAELMAVIEQLKIMKDWDDDGDGKLSQTEVVPRIFAAWDVNGDGELTEDEWKIR